MVLFKIAGTGFEPVTFGLWARRASRLLHPAVCAFRAWKQISQCLICFSGRKWIRTTEGSANRFTVCSLWPLGNPPILPSFPDKWLPSKDSKWKLQGSNLWPSACKADALPAELNFQEKVNILNLLPLKPYDLRETTQIGLEPTTSAVTGRRSNQLSHWAWQYLIKNGPSGTRTQDRPVMSRLL